MTCPECGQNLAESGTLPSGARRSLRPPRFVAIPCRLALVAIPAAIFLNLAQEESRRVVTRAQVHATSRAGLFTSLRIEGRGVRTGQSQYPTMESNPRPSTRAVLVGPGGTARLSVRDAAVRVRYDRADGRRHSTPDAMSDDDVFLWMQAAGIDVEHERAAAEARHIAFLIRQVVAGADGAWATNLIVTRAHSHKDTAPEPLVLAIILIAATVASYILIRPMLPDRRIPGGALAGSEDTEDDDGLGSGVPREWVGGPWRGRGGDGGILVSHR